MSEKVDNHWERDQQFETYKVKGARPCDRGWELSLEDGGCILCTNERCQREPQQGETARFYGKGFGYRVRGIVIEGRVYRYQTPAEDEVEFKAQCDQWQRERDEATEKHKAEIAQGKHMPVPFQLKASGRADWERGLANNSDPYGRCCYLFAADWAALMEKEIASGKTVAAVAKDASREADRKHGVTGFMYGVAVSLLAHCWEHGEDLRRWHNLDTQVGKEGERANEEGGTLNPALLNIGSCPR